MGASPEPSACRYSDFNSRWATSWSRTDTSTICGSDCSPSAKLAIFRRSSAPGLPIEELPRPLDCMRLREHDQGRCKRRARADRRSQSSSPCRGEADAVCPDVRGDRSCQGGIDSEAPLPAARLCVRSTKEAAGHFSGRCDAWLLVSIVKGTTVGPVGKHGNAVRLSSLSRAPTASVGLRWLLAYTEPSIGSIEADRCHVPALSSASSSLATPARPVLACHRGARHTFPDKQPSKQHA